MSPVYLSKYTHHASVQNVSESLAVKGTCSKLKAFKIHFDQNTLLLILSPVYLSKCTHHASVQNVSESLAVKGTCSKLTIHSVVLEFTVSKLIAIEQSKPTTTNHSFIFAHVSNGSTVRR